MGWVTLSLRKRELKQEHQYYQLRDLQISREKRKLARQKSYEMAVIQNNQKQAENAVKSQYDTAEILNTISDLRKKLQDQKSENEKSDKATTAGSTDQAYNLSYTLDGQTESISASNYEDASKGVNAAISTLTSQYSEMATKRTSAINDIKDLYDDQKSALEQEVGDEETELEMEQTDIEAQMEAISAEIEAVGQAISQEIKNSTIKLS